MNRFLRFFILFTLLYIIRDPFSSYATTIDQEIAESYQSSNYEMTIKLLEQSIGQLKRNVVNEKNLQFSDLYRKYLLLANIYAWRLNKPDVALLKYQELKELRQSCEEASKFPPFELLYIAEIYEVRNDYLRAKENYQSLLNELISFKEREKDDLSILIGEDLIKFIKYQIDDLQLKASAGKKQKLLLARLKLSSRSPYYFFPFSAFVPTTENMLSPDKSIDLVGKIKQSPLDFSSMILNYVLILAASAGAVDESSEKAMEVYLLKYPESYYSLQLRYLFHKFYNESGQTKKAKRLVKELEKIASKRGMEIVIGPDKRFSSPEKTWETYKNALIAWDLDLVIECYVPGRRRHGKVYDALSREKMREIGKEMGEIQKVKTSETMAEYMIMRKKNGKEYSYTIRFQNIEGEWKMYEF